MKKFFTIKNIGLLGIFLYSALFIGGISYTPYIMPLMLIGIFVSLKANKSIRIGYPPILILYIIIFLTGITLNFFSNTPIRGMKEFSYVNFTFIYCYIFLNNIFDEKYVKYLVNTFIGAGFILAIICIEDYWSHFYLVRKHVELIYDYRTIGLDRYYSSAFYFMITGIILFIKIYLCNFYKDKKFLIKYIFSLLILSSIFQALLLTKTRSGIFTFIFIVFTFMISHFNLKKIIFFTLLFSGIYFSNPNHVTGFSKYFSLFSKNISITKNFNNHEKNKILNDRLMQRDGSDRLREIMWMAAKETILKNPITGVGSNKETLRKSLYSYTYTHTDSNGKINGIIDASNFRSRFIEFHSMYLNLMAQYGIFSILYFIQLFILIPKLFLKTLNLIKNNSNNHFERNTILGFFFAYISLLIVSVAWPMWTYLEYMQELFHYFTFIAMFFYMKYTNSKIINLKI